MRPRLAAGQLTDLALAHLTNLDLMVQGTGDESLMWQLAEQSLLWSRVAELTGQLQDDMRQQLQVVASVVRRFRTTGRVGYSGAEYQTAKAGIDVMDQLAELVEKHQAVEAALWAEQVVQNAQAQVWAAGLLDRWAQSSMPEPHPN
jgi:hypothetical protein